MKAVITDGCGRVWVDSVAMPIPKAYQCLCRIDACATCTGTDQRLVKGYFDWADKYPALLGHESVGTVVECGSAVKKYRVGDRVLRPAVAMPGTMFGDLASWMGGFAEYGLICDINAADGDVTHLDPFGYSRAQQLIPADIDIGSADATMLVMLREVAGACLAAGIVPGMTVLVLGAGGVAQSMAFFSKLMGAKKVIVAARRAAPLEQCLRNGADATVNLQNSSLVDGVLQITSGKLVDRVLDAAGNVELAVSAAGLLGDGGVMSSYAVSDGPFPVEKVQSRGAWRMLRQDEGVAEFHAHNYVLNCIRNGSLRAVDFYSHQLKIEEFEMGFEMLCNKQASKIVFTMA